MTRPNSAEQGAYARVHSEPVHGRAPAEVPTFPRLYETYFHFIWSLVRYFRVERSEMDDVVQEIFIAIHSRIGTLEKPESLRSWVYSIVRRIAGSYHRRRRSALVITNAEYIEPETLQPECVCPQHLTEQIEQAQLLCDLLKHLDPAKREVIVLAEIEEMTAPEIAAAIDVPLNTVYSRLRIARQELEQVLHRYRTQSRRREGVMRRSPAPLGMGEHVPGID